MGERSGNATSSPEGPAPRRICDRCGSPGGEPAFRAQDHLTGERFGILRCAGCGLLRTDFRGSSEDLARYYGPSYYGSAGRRFLSVLERAVRLFRRFRARAVMRAAGRPGRILDLGCGRGFTLAALREMGWECVGTELSEEMAAEARKTAGVQVLLGGPEEFPFPGGSFDAVTAWHSLEHMERPVRTVREVARLLKPGGLLLVEVPDANSLQARVGGGRWFHFDVPRHLYHFTREGLAAILAEEGFAVHRESTLSLEQGPFGMVQSLLNRVTFAPNVLYRLIRRAGTAGRAGAAGSTAALRVCWDVGITLLLVLPVGALGSTLELLACAVGRGGVIRCAAQKKPREGSSAPGP